MSGCWEEKAWTTARDKMLVGEINNETRTILKIVYIHTYTLSLKDESAVYVVFLRRNSGRRFPRTHF